MHLRALSQPEQRCTVTAATVVVYACALVFSERAATAAAVCVLVLRVHQSEMSCVRAFPSHDGM
jgi:anti-sigma-K factor RskA